MALTMTPTKAEGDAITQRLKHHWRLTQDYMAQGHDKETASKKAYDVVKGKKVKDLHKLKAESIVRALVDDVLEAEKKWHTMPGSTDMRDPNYNYQKKQAHTRQVTSPKLRKYIKHVKKVHPYGSLSK
jgi:hypothetical protein